jgi:hypothetical protein
VNPEASDDSDPEPVKRPDVDARLREAARNKAEIDEVRDQHAAQEPLFPPRGLTEEEKEMKADFDAMSPEEQDEWLRGFQSVLQEHQDEIRAAGIPGLDVDKVLERMRDGMAKREKLGRLEDEALEMVFQTLADQADITARTAVNLAELMRHWEGLSEEQWQSLPPDERLKLQDLLNEWKNGEREQWLSQLPIEVRRRYE